MLRTAPQNIPKGTHRARERDTDRGKAAPSLPESCRYWPHRRDTNRSLSFHAEVTIYHTATLTLSPSESLYCSLTIDTTPLSCTSHDFCLLSINNTFRKKLALRPFPRAWNYHSSPQRLKLLGPSSNDLRDIALTQHEIHAPSSRRFAVLAQTRPHPPLGDTNTLLPHTPWCPPFRVFMPE